MSRSLRSSSTRRGFRRAASAVGLAGALALTSACGGDMDSESADAAPTSAQQPAQEPAQQPAAPADPAPADSTESDAAVSTITAVEDDFSISLDTEELTAGTYEIEVVNEGSASHDLVVERDGEDIAATEILSPGDSATLTVDLAAGEYVFYCSVANHRGMGMELTVDVA